MIESKIDQQSINFLSENYEYLINIFASIIGQVKGKQKILNQSMLLKKTLNSYVCLL